MDLKLIIIIAALAAVGALDLVAQSRDSHDLDLYRRGRQIFVSQCTPCHGKTGRGDGPWGEGMRPAPRNLRSGIFKYRSTPVGKLPTDDDLRRTLTRGISGTGMPTFKDRLSEKDMDAMIVYIKSLSPRWRDSKNHATPKVVPPIPDWLSSGGKERDAAILAGKSLFAQTCVPCHGASAKGDGIAAASLTDAWGSPAAPADLTQPHLRSGERPEDVYRTIAMGLDGTAMAGFQEALTEEQIWQLVAFIKSLPTQPEGSE